MWHCRSLLRHPEPVPLKTSIYFFLMYHIETNWDDYISEQSSIIITPLLLQIQWSASCVNFRKCRNIGGQESETSQSTFVLKSRKVGEKLNLLIQNSTQQDHAETFRWVLKLKRRSLTSKIIFGEGWDALFLSRTRIIMNKHLMLSVNAG